MVLLTTTAVGLRLWIRFSKGPATFHPSDVAILVTDVLGMICGATATALLSLDLHPMTNAQRLLDTKVFLQCCPLPLGSCRLTLSKLTVVALVNYWVLAWMVKASFLSLYWDSRSLFNQELRLALVLGTIYAAATFIIVLLSNLLWCRPISSMW